MFMGTTPFITVRASRPLSEIEFCAWVAQAVPGDRLEYHRGENTGSVLNGNQQRKPFPATGWNTIAAFWCSTSSLCFQGCRMRRGPN